MSTGNLPRLRECLIELHLPAFREHYAAQAALATQESLSQLIRPPAAATRLGSRAFRPVDYFTQKP